jgi:GMP synthase-like glutamine amidotransferase
LRLHAIQHVPFEGLGSIHSWAARTGCEISIIRQFRGEILPAPEEVTHLIVMGGPMGVHDHATFPWLAAEKDLIRRVIDAGRSVLGICLGAQLMADALGARVVPNATPEIGWYPIHKSAEAQSHDMAGFLPAALDVFHWHGDTFEIPDGAICLAHSEACRNQGFIRDGRVIGLQFHLETTADSLQALIDHCSADLVEGPHIQSAGAMYAVKDRFAPNQQVMDDLLSRWIAA